MVISALYQNDVQFDDKRIPFKMVKCIIICSVWFLIILKHSNRTIFVLMVHFSHTFERCMFITAKIADSQQIIAFDILFSLFYQLDPLVLRWNFVADNIILIFSMSNVKHHR